MSRTVERIVFLDRDTLRADVRKPSFAHEWREFGATPPEEVEERLREATIAILNKVHLHADTLRRLTKLKMVALAATGVDNVDVNCCRERGVAVANVRGYAQHSVPEHVFMLMLALRRNLLAYRRDMRAGAWRRAEQFCILEHPIKDLHASMLGIIGYGALGRAVEKLARAFDMNVLVAEHKGAASVREGRTPFEEVLARSDVLTLHVPLNDETRHLIGAAELASMRESSLLINCARGGVVDEEALAEALRSGVIGGAGVDVLSVEPPREATSASRLLELELPNLIVTPHVAWASGEAMQSLADQLIDNIEAFVRGEPQNLVTP